MLVGLRGHLWGTDGGNVDGKGKVGGFVGVEMLKEAGDVLMMLGGQVGTGRDGDGQIRVRRVTGGVGWGVRASRVVWDAREASKVC